MSGSEHVSKDASVPDMGKLDLVRLYGFYLFADYWYQSGRIETKHEGECSTFNLADLGLGQQTERDIKALEIIAIGWNICNSWLGVAATLALTIALGGSVTLIYGIVVCFIMVGCSGLTMAELASVYPTAGGQYHWTSVLAPSGSSRILV
jgi:hypothetical protein